MRELRRCRSDARAKPALRIYDHLVPLVIEHGKSARTTSEDIVLEWNRPPFLITLVVDQRGWESEGDMALTIRSEGKCVFSILVDVQRACYIATFKGGLWESELAGAAPPIAADAPEPDDWPKQSDVGEAPVWAVRYGATELIWRKAEIVRETAARVTVRLDGVIAVVGQDTTGFKDYAAWSSRHRCRFVFKRGGLAESVLEVVQAQLARRTANKGMPRTEAATLLGLPHGERYTVEDVQAAFRREAWVCHPDQGGCPTSFQAIVAARDTLLAAGSGAAQ